MASNVLYPLGSANLLKGNFKLCTSLNGELSGTAAVLMSSSYTYSTAHEYYHPDIVGDKVHIPMVLSTVTCTTGTLDGDTVTFTGVQSGTPAIVIGGLALFQSGTSMVDDYLLAYFCTGSDGNPINITTNGGDVTIQWNSSGILNISGSCP